MTTEDTRTSTRGGPVLWSVVLGDVLAAMRARSAATAPLRSAVSVLVSHPPTPRHRRAQGAATAGSRDQ